MITKIHNKLVRDKIPQILAEKGIRSEAEIVKNEGAFQRLLWQKLIEESREAAVAEKEHLLEELGDVETVIDAILEINGLTRDELIIQQDTKDRARGKFNERIFLKETKEKDDN